MVERGEVADLGSVSKMEPTESPDGLDGMDAQERVPGRVEWLRALWGCQNSGRVAQHSSVVTVLFLGGTF